MTNLRISILYLLLCCIISKQAIVQSFSIPNNVHSAGSRATDRIDRVSSNSRNNAPFSASILQNVQRQTFLQAQDGNTERPLLSSEKDEIALGVVGTTMSVIMLGSEYVLKSTGCGLPAGPYGIFGAAEGISYLGVTALAAFSVYTKVKTGSGLPAGPKGVLGLAEGLSFLAITAGIVVLAFQVLDFGYIPNAVPVEGGLCQ
jgi:hypothetical protein